jgi:hypothetical protein
MHDPEVLKAVGICFFCRLRPATGVDALEKGVDSFFSYAHDNGNAVPCCKWCNKLKWMTSVIQCN